MPWKRTKLSRVIAGSAILLTFAATASAADAATLPLGSPSLTGRVAITEPVTVTCSAFDPSLTLTSEFVNVQVERAAGTAIARGSASMSSFLPTFRFPCDGTQSTIPVTVYADSAGPPFHGGKAVHGINDSWRGHAVFPGSTTCFTNPSSSQSATAGPTTLNLHRGGRRNRRFARALGAKRDQVRRPLGGGPVGLRVSGRATPLPLRAVSAGNQSSR
jgi:hypothetical protein